MLRLFVPNNEFFDEVKQEFIIEGDTLELEHSLVSLSKWESKYEKPFLGKEDKTEEEIRYYIECMIVDPNFPSEVFARLTDANFNQVNEYVNAKQTATWINEIPDGKKSREIITSELIYYWMVSMRIPFECQNWHLNRLFTLIRVIDVKSKKPRHMSQSEIAARNRALNEERKAKYKTTG